MGFLGGMFAGAAGGLLSALEQRHQGKAWNKYVMHASNALSPQSVMGAAYQYNPFLWAALGIDQSKLGKGMGDYAGSPYSQQLARLINDPGSIDPAMMNRSFMMADRGADAGLNRTMGMLGRSGGEGGLGGAMMLASQASRTNQKSQIMQQFIMLREQMRRADLEMIDQMITRSTGLAAQTRSRQADIMLNRKPVLGHAGVGANIIKGAMEGAAAGMGGTSAMDTPGPGDYQPTMGAPQMQSQFGFGGAAQNPFGGGASQPAVAGFGGQGGATQGMFGQAANGGSLATSTSAPTPWRTSFGLGG